MKKEKKSEKNDIELKIYSIATSISESIIFLDEADGSRIFPIWIGPIEAQAIAIRLSGFPSPRPMTHDLIYSILDNLGYKIKKVKLTDILENTYYAMLYITDSKGNFVRKIDARPSDAIAMAVRYGCPIYISGEIMHKIQALNKPITESEVAKFKNDLKHLKPTDIINQLLKNPKKEIDEDDSDDDDSDEDEDQKGEK